MSWVDIGNPSPRTERRTYAPLVWPRGRIIRLESALENRSASSFAAIVHRRRTCRSFLASPKVHELGDLFSLTCESQTSSDGSGGLVTRPAPSAGAMYPIHVVVNWAGDSAWYRYDAARHVLVGVESKVDPETVRDDLRVVLDGAKAALLLFVAEPERTLAKYADGCSLVWRDAGVLQGYFSLAAEALDLNFALLGVTGEPWSSQLVEASSLVGVGAAYVGAR